MDLTNIAALPTQPGLYAHLSSLASEARKRARVLKLDTLGVWSTYGLDDETAEILAHFWSNSGDLVQVVLESYRGVVQPAARVV